MTAIIHKTCEVCKERKIIDERDVCQDCINKVMEDNKKVEEAQV